MEVYLSDSHPDRNISDERTPSPQELIEYDAEWASEPILVWWQKEHLLPLPVDLIPDAQTVVILTELSPLFFLN
jgi:hypothetical protein